MSNFQLHVQGNSADAVVYAVERELLEPTPSRYFVEDRELRPRALSSRERRWIRPLTEEALSWWRNHAWYQQKHTFSSDSSKKERAEYLRRHLQEHVRSTATLGLVEWLLISKIAIQIILLLLQYWETEWETEAHLDSIP